MKWKTKSFKVDENVFERSRFDNDYFNPNFDETQNCKQDQKIKELEKDGRCVTRSNRGQHKIKRIFAVYAT